MLQGVISKISQRDIIQYTPTSNKSDTPKLTFYTTNNRVAKLIPNYSNVSIESLKSDAIWINNYLEFELILDIHKKYIGKNNEFVYYEMSYIDSEQSLKWLELSKHNNTDLYYDSVISPFIKVFIDTISSTNSAYTDIGGDHLFQDTNNKILVIDWDDFFFIKNETRAEKIERFKVQLKKKCTSDEMYEFACKELDV